MIIVLWFTAFWKIALASFFAYIVVEIFLTIRRARLDHVSYAEEMADYKDINKCIGKEIIPTVEYVEIINKDKDAA